MFEPVRDDDPDLHFFGPPQPGERLLSETLDDKIGGMRVRYVLRVVSGKHTREIDARQGKAILEVLELLRQQHDQQEPAQPGSQEAGHDSGK
jgi:hypothetical protein